MKIDNDLLRSTSISDLTSRVAGIIEGRLKNGAELVSLQFLHDSTYIVAVLFWRYQ